MSDLNTESKTLKITAVYYALVPFDDPELDSITENSNGSITVVFNGENDWKKIYGPFANIEFDEPAEDHPAGEYYKQGLVIVNPGDELELQTEIETLKTYPLVVRFDYNNGSSKIFGDFDNPVYMKYDFSSKSFTTKRQVVFYRNSAKQAKFLNL